MKEVKNMEKKRPQPPILPDPPATKPGMAEPIIGGEMRCPGEGRIVTDPQGSYTGRPVDGGVPVQDADDL